MDFSSSNVHVCNAPDQRYFWAAEQDNLLWRGLRISDQETTCIRGSNLILCMYIYNIEESVLILMYKRSVLYFEG